MKKLSAIIFGILMTGSVFSQELKFSKDPYEFIPKEEYSNVQTWGSKKDGIPDIYWWDKDKNGECDLRKEVFVDVNEDDIPDMSYADFIKWHEEEGKKKE